MSSMQRTALETNIRGVEEIVPGQQHGEITAAIGSEGLRRRLAPFVFLDHFDVRTDKEWGFPYHPHSGVATFTFPRTSRLRHEDTGGNSGFVAKGGVQWMAAGGGLWHQELYEPDEGRVEGLQLWMILPPELESGPVAYQEIEPVDLPVTGDTRVLAGSYGATSSPVQTPYPFNYFEVVLTQPGWEFDPPDGHDVAWLYVAEGEIEVGGRRASAGDVVAFERLPGRLQVSGGVGSRFVAGTAAAFAHQIVFGRFSMHTSSAALESGLRRIRALGQRLRAEGKLR